MNTVNPKDSCLCDPMRLQLWVIQLFFGFWSSLYSPLLCDLEESVDREAGGRLRMLPETLLRFTVLRRTHVKHACALLSAASHPL